MLLILLFSVPVLSDDTETDIVPDTEAAVDFNEPADDWEEEVQTPDEAPVQECEPDLEIAQEPEPEPEPSYEAEPVQEDPQPDVEYDPGETVDCDPEPSDTGDIDLTADESADESTYDDAPDEIDISDVIADDSGDEDQEITTEIDLDNEINLPDGEDGSKDPVQETTPETIDLDPGNDTNPENEEHPEDEQQENDEQKETTPDEEKQDEEKQEQDTQTDTEDDGPQDADGPAPDGSPAFEVPAEDIRYTVFPNEWIGITVMPDEADTEIVDITDASNEINLTEESDITTGTGTTYTGTSTYYNVGSYYYPYYQSPMRMTRDTWMNSLSPYERLIVDMTKTEKVPAVAKRTLNIKEAKDSGSRTVGVISTNGLCYVLEDGEWAYIESGEVRGFVRSEDLISGNTAVDMVVDTGEMSMLTAESLVSPAENAAFGYLTVTTALIPEMPSYTSYGIRYGTPQSSRNEIVAYAESAGLGTAYTSMSGLVQDIYGHFGIILPSTSAEQCYMGERIDAKNAMPGDLLFYADGSNVVETLIYTGGGMAMQATQEGGYQILDVDYGQVCWGCKIIEDGGYSSTQASDLALEGRKAAMGDELARQNIIEALAEASEGQWETYGFPRSVLIAQAIQESNWVSFGDAMYGGMSPDDNNILGMNADLLNGSWESPWEGSSAVRIVPAIEGGELVYGNEQMRIYSDIESCMEDYAAFKTAMHPDLKGSTDVNIAVQESLLGSATDPDYQAAIIKLIEEYDLTQYDAKTQMTDSAGNVTAYTQDQLELIWAIVGQEDSSSYEGALAVMTAAMNRADSNYGGYGTDVLSQLTADGQFCYSPSVSDPIYYQRRLNGNVAAYVKQAVSDCFNGRRNHSFQNFRSSNRTGNYVQIGGNWYF